MTAIALLLAGSNRIPLLRRLPREAARTTSPNSGWPMGALALSLNVRLRKPNVYALNASGRAPSAADTCAALHRAEVTAWIGAALFAIGMQFLPRIGNG
jgi:adenosylcobinamide-phosphate synthase